MITNYFSGKSNTELTSPLPSAIINAQGSINLGVTKFTEYTAAVKLAIKQFYAGGTGQAKQSLYKYLPSAYQLATPYGDFESAGDVAQWTVIDPGGNSPTVSYSTDHAFTGTGSVKIVFTKSDQNNYTGLKRTFSTALDVTNWRYVTAEFWNTVSVGGAYTRTISIILTDNGGNTKTFSLSGLSTASPFNTAGWIKVTGEILNPTSVTGTSFDNSNVTSIELRFIDSANRAGTIYWDTVRLESQLTLILPIYHEANDSINVPIDPVEILETGDKVLISQSNFSTTRNEYFAMTRTSAL